MKNDLLASRPTGMFFTALLGMALLQPVVTRADDLFALAWRGTEYTSSGGKVVAKPFSQLSFVKKVATDYGLDARDLVLVYRPDKRDITMVRRSTGAFVASIIQMEYSYTDVSNANNSATVRQAFLFDEYHDSAIGTAAGTERVRRDANGNIVGYSFSGRFNYAYPEDDVVFAGSFTTASRIVDRTGN